MYNWYSSPKQFAFARSGVTYVRITGLVAWHVCVETTTSGPEENAVVWDYYLIKKVMAVVGYSVNKTIQSSYYGSYYDSPPLIFFLVLDSLFKL